MLVVAHVVRLTIKLWTETKVSTPSPDYCEIRDENTGCMVDTTLTNWGIPFDYNEGR